MSTPKYGSWQTPSPRPNMTTTVTPFDTKGPKRLWNAPPGFVVRERGASGCVATNVYVCPEHGSFEAKSDLDDEICGTWTGIFCGRRSPWSPSTFSAWQSSGMVRG